MENLLQWLQAHVSYQSIIGLVLVVAGLWLFSSTIGVLIRLFLCAVLVAGGGYMFYRHTFGQVAQDKKNQEQMENEKQKVLESLRGFKGQVGEKAQQAKEAWRTTQEINQQAKELNKLNAQKEELLREKDKQKRKLDSLNDFNRQMNR